MRFSIKDFFSKCDKIRSFLENFIFCAMATAHTSFETTLKAYYKNID